MNDLAPAGWAGTGPAKFRGEIRASGAGTFGGDVTLDDGAGFTTVLQCVTPTANQTISLPNDTGTVALIKGSANQLIYNNAGVYAGTSRATYSDTNGSITLGGATVTTSNPVLDLSQTWNAGAVTFTGIRLNVTNTTSATASLLADLQVGGTTQFNVTRGGAVTTTGSTTSTAFIPSASTVPTNGVYLPAANSVGISTNTGERVRINSTGLVSFGGATSSFPALKQSSAILQARLADDSGYTVMDAQLRAQGTAPATTGATGTAGDIRYDADYIYVCTATNTWKRAALSTW